MRTLTKVLTLLLTFLCAVQSDAQDVHFSHIHASSTILNPAMTGLFKGDVRFTANYRSQWQSITNGYRTMAGGADMKLMTMKKDIVAGGLQVISDKAGDLDFTTNIVNLNFAYLKSLDGRGRSFISFGMQNSVISNSVDFTKIDVFEAEPLAQGATNKFTYWDLSAGAAYFHTINKNSSFHVGTTIFHLNKPLLSFFERDDPSSTVLAKKRFLIHGGGDFQIGKNSSLKPTFIFMDQGPHREITMGSFYKFQNVGGGNKYDRNVSSLYFGAWVRWHAEKEFTSADAIIASVRWDLNKTFITFSFDVNISTLTNVSSGRGGPEISVVHILDNSRAGKRRAKVECPDL